MAGYKRIEEKAEALAAPIAAARGVRIYDVEYVKAGGEYSLNVYIDKDGGVNIDDCEAVSRPLSDALDEADFIQDAYTLVVSSPGLGRKLTRDRHLAQSIGQEVELKLYKVDAETASKELSGVLLGYDNEGIRIETESGERIFPKKAIAVIRLALDF